MIRICLSEIIRWKKPFTALIKRITTALKHVTRQPCVTQYCNHVIWQPYCQTQYSERCGKNIMKAARPNIECSHCDHGRMTSDSNKNISFIPLAQRKNGFYIAVHGRLVYAIAILWNNIIIDSCVHYFIFYCLWLQGEECGCSVAQKCSQCRYWN